MGMRDRDGPALQGAWSRRTGARSSRKRLVRARKGISHPPTALVNQALREPVAAQLQARDPHPPPRLARGAGRGSTGETRGWRYVVTLSKILAEIVLMGGLRETPARPTSGVLNEGPQETPGTAYNPSLYPDIPLTQPSTTGPPRGVCGAPPRSLQYSVCPIQYFLGQSDQGDEEEPPEQLFVLVHRQALSLVVLR